MSTAEVVALGENALLVRLSDTLDKIANRKARLIADLVEAEAIPGITDVVPANASVGIYFTDDTGFDRVNDLVWLILDRTAPVESESRLHEIRVNYDGPDLQSVAAFAGLDVESVIEIHSGREYDVFAIGFAPGFGYLGEVDARISVPRRSEPRAKVPAGSVAIANNQTAVYPLETPGGWNLIGRTTERMFDISRKTPSLLSVGDRVRFIRA